MAAPPPYYPVVSNKALDCQVRQTAYDYAQALQPDRPGGFPGSLENRK
jgi:hypothetical protein